MNHKMGHRWGRADRRLDAGLDEFCSDRTSVIAASRAAALDNTATP